MESGYKDVRSVKLDAEDVELGADSLCNFPLNSRWNSKHR